MKLNRTALVALALLCMVGLASALAIRGSSGNGVDSNAVSWLLVGRSPAQKVAGNGKQAVVTREIVCLNQDVEASLGSPTDTLSGSCDSGNYMYVYQVQSTSLNVNVAVSGLTGFSPTNTSTFGVMLCDNPSLNSIEMCTTATQGQLPSITTTTSKSQVVFTVPGTFPTYPAGQGLEGQGLTFFVITQQTTPLPLGAPHLAIH